MSIHILNYVKAVRLMVEVARLGERFKMPGNWE